VARHSAKDGHKFRERRISRVLAFDRNSRD
jgi:hypothetical protein